MAITKVSRGLISTSIVDNGNATAITIDSSENVSFTGAATFSGTVTGTQFSSTSSSAALPSFGVTAGNGMYNPATNSIGWSTNSVERARLDASGNLGIGVLAPTYKIDATTTSGGNGLKMARGTNSFFEQFQSTSGGVSLAASGSGAFMAFRAGTTAGTTTERMRIDASGNLGIGTATPTQTLHVNSSNLMFTLENTSTNADQYAQQQFKSGTALNYFWGANQNSTAWGGPSSLNIQSNSGAIAFFTSGSTMRMRIHETSGNIDIPNGDLTFASGHGIDFSATPNSGTTGTTHTSSLLDDYEEGTWTPILVGTGGTFTNSSQLGSYTKIGNLIHLTFYVGASAIGTATGTINIGNLPYTALGGGTTNQRITTGSCMVDALPFNAGATMIVPYMSHGATVIQFYQSGSNIGWNTTPADASFTFIGGISYRTV